MRERRHGNIAGILRPSGVIQREIQKHKQTVIQESQKCGGEGLRRYILTRRFRFYECIGSAVMPLPDAMSDSVPPLTPPSNVESAQL
jgi:hypothetical protein